MYFLNSFLCSNFKTVIGYPILLKSQTICLLKFKFKSLKLIALLAFLMIGSMLLPSWLGVLLNGTLLCNMHLVWNKQSWRLHIYFTCEKKIDKSTIWQCTCCLETSGNPHLWDWTWPFGSLIWVGRALIMPGTCKHSQLFIYSRTFSNSLKVFLII